MMKRTIDKTSIYFLILGITMIVLGIMSIPNITQIIIACGMGIVLLLIMLGRILTSKEEKPTIQEEDKNTE